MIVHPDGGTAPSKPSLSRTPACADAAVIRHVANAHLETTRTIFFTKPPGSNLSKNVARYMQESGAVKILHLFQDGNKI
jgi:hypothetical protein